MAIPVVSEKDFEREVIHAQLPVLVVFTATWSAPCKALDPVLDAYAREVEGKAKIVKVDADASPRLADMLRVQNLPTLYVFSGGRPVNAAQGASKREQLAALLDPVLPRPEGAIKARELAQLLKDRQVAAVDTREASAFGRAHIPGAINMPLDEIEGRLAELHMLGADPILYCRSGDKSKDLADKLAAQGVPVGFLEGGFLHWEAEQLPIERD
jgi:thioredoxin 1/putative thioredoxin